MDENHLNENWFSIDVEEKMTNKINELEKNQSLLLDRINELEKSMSQPLDRINVLEKSLDQLQTENLKLLNRLLETEVSIERTKNILLRKNISFPFTPFHWSNSYLNLKK